MGDKMATATATSTQVFTKAELDALRAALNKGRNRQGNYVAPPSQQSDPQSSDDWENDVALLVKFLKDLNDVLETLIAKRIPETERKGFEIVYETVQEDVNTAIKQLNEISGPTHTRFAGLRKVGLTGSSLLVKLREFADRIVHGPVLAVLEMGDIILRSLGDVVPVEALEELKDTIKNRTEFGADDEIIQLHLNS